MSPYIKVRAGAGYLPITNACKGLPEVCKGVPPNRKGILAFLIPNNLQVKSGLKSGKGDSRVKTGASRGVLPASRRVLPASRRVLPASRGVLPASRRVLPGFSLEHLGFQI